LKASLSVSPKLIESNVITLLSSLEMPSRPDMNSVDAAAELVQGGVRGFEVTLAS